MTFRGKRKIKSTMNSLKKDLVTMCFLHLILLLNCGNSVTLEKYIHFELLDNHTCTPDANMSSTSVVPSIIKCVADCEYNDRCRSIFYGDDDGTCTLCSEVFNYYADRPAVAPENTKHLRPLQGSCPEGWWSFQYSCYTLTNTSNGFQHDECVAMGAHAVYVESIEEQHFLAYTMKPASGERDLFLGYMKVNNILYLAGTLTLPTFTYFASGEGTRAIERCVFFRSTQWGDSSCGKNSKTVCEIEL